MTTVKSVQAELSGDPSKMKLMEIATGDIPTADPVADDKGWALQGAEYLHIYVEFDTTTAVDITPWYYSSISGQWHEGTQISFSSSSTFALVRVSGEERVFFVMDSFTGAGVVHLWAGYSHVVPGREL